MLKFFKSASQPARPAAPARPAMAVRPRPSPAAARAGTPPVPPPLPEVHEGNEESDWAMWEDSVAFQDSQMPSVFNEFDAVRTRDDEPPKKSGGPDPFATVRKRGT